MKSITYVDVRDEAVRQIKAAFGKQNKIKIEARAGRIYETELRRLAQQTPAVLTTPLKIRDGSNSDNSAVHFATFILYRAINTDRRYDGALKLVSFLIPVIRSITAEWSYNVEDVEAENLYTGSLDQLNITLWAISWTWKMRGDVIDQDNEQSGGILLPDDLEWFKGTDSGLLVGNDTVNDATDIEVEE